MDKKQKIHDIVMSYKEDMLRDLRDLVAVESIQGRAEEGMPFGRGPALALQKIISQADSLGFMTKNLDNYCGYAEAGVGDKIIGVLGHVDTVPIGSGWTRGPFSGEIDGNFMYGRGVCDNKGGCIASLYALKTLLDMGIDPQKKIRLLYGANEETGMKCMEYYREKEGDFEYAIAPDSTFPITYGEKGIYNGFFEGSADSDSDIKLLDICAGEAFNVVPPFCDALLSVGGRTLEIASAFKKYCDENRLAGEAKADGENISLHLIGEAAHASKPETGINAISHMVAFLKKLIPDAPFIKGYSECIGLGYYGEGLGLNLCDEYSRLTFNVGIIRQEQGNIRASIDIRYPVTIKDFAPHIASMEEGFKRYGISLKTVDVSVPLFKDPESLFVKSLYGVYVDMTGDTKNPPLVIGGGSYAKKFTNAVTFGYEFPGEENFIHSSDERLSIDNFLFATEIIAHAILKLLEL